MLVDSHCHIHSQEFYSDNREEVYQRAANADMKLICVGTDQADSKAALDFANQRLAAYATVGVHPHEAKYGCDGILDLIESDNGKLVGVGEIGLDYYYGHSPRKDQLEVFEKQLAWAVKYDLPVSFHVRDAFDDFWSVLGLFGGVRGVLHSFTDTVVNMERALTEGLYIGVNGISTFTKDTKQQVMFDAVPLESMLLETDAPFLTPTPLRGKINEPIYVRQVAEYHANRRQVSLEQIADITSANAKRLFAI